MKPLREVTSIFFAVTCIQSLTASQEGDLVDR